MGDEILYALNGFSPLLDNILCLSKSQLLWIMVKGPYEIQMKTIRYWLDRASPQDLCDLRKVLGSVVNSENFLLNILMNPAESKSLTVQKAAEVLQRMHRRDLRNKMFDLIISFAGNTDIVSLLIKATCYDVPDDKHTALNIFNVIWLIFTTHPEDDILTEICYYSTNLLTVLKSEVYFMESVCTNLFLMRSLISRLSGINDRLDLAIVDFLTAMLRFQDGDYVTNDKVYFPIRLLLNSSSDVVEKTITWLHHWLQKRTIHQRTVSDLKEEDIAVVLDKFYDMRNVECLCEMIYECSRSMLWLYKGDLIHSTILCAIVEERCRISRKKGPSSAFSRLIANWVKCVRMVPNSNVLLLPDMNVLTRYIRESRKFRPVTANIYLQFVKDIYDTKFSSEYDNCVDNVALYL